jgi:hypothetical protein
MTPRKFANAVLVGLFLAVITVYGGASFWNTFADQDKIAEFARTSWRYLPTWAEANFNDHLAARSALVDWHGRVKADWLQTSPSPRVWLGRDGWLFYNHTADAGFVPPSDPVMPARLDRWAAALSARRAWLAERGINYLLVMVPNKQSVYTEMVPRLARHRGPTPLDGLLERCGHDSDLHMLDLRPVLRASRQFGRLFWQTDTHWAPVGDYAGYAATVDALTRWYPGDGPVPWSEFQARPMRLPVGDLARLTGLDHERTEDVPRLERLTPSHVWRLGEAVNVPADTKLGHVDSEVWVSDQPNRPRVVLLGDSFADHDYCSLLAEHCSRLVRVGTYQDQQALIERERPDVVIFEFVERMLEGFEPQFKGQKPDVSDQKPE